VEDEGTAIFKTGFSANICGAWLIPKTSPFGGAYGWSQTVGISEKWCG